MYNLYTKTQNELKTRISNHYRTEEKKCVENLLNGLNINVTVSLPFH